MMRTMGASTLERRGNAVQEQVDDLKERMRLLQGDRKANIDILETSKTTNKEEMRRLREENKDLRIKLSQLQLGKRNGEAVQELGHMENEVQRLRKSCDDHKSTAQSHRTTLQSLKDQVRDLELEVRHPSQEDSPLQRQIRTLENRLDKAMIKYNEAQSIRKTYEQIVKRLRDERVGFDNQLGALERTLGAKQKDHEELQLISGDAMRARDMAHGELDKVRAGYEEERRRREIELRERRQVVQLRHQMRDRNEKRELIKARIMAQEMGDLSEEQGEKNLKSALAVSTITATKMASERQENKSRIDVFESAFTKIKEATGVSDVNEVIQKIVSQEATAENLMLLTKENQAKIESLNKVKAGLKARVEEMKYSGPGEGHRRKMVDDQEEQLSNSAARLERVKHKYERLVKVLISIKAGIEHLQDKLRSVAEETQVAVEPIRLTDDTVVDVLEGSQKILAEISSRVRIAEYEMGAAATTLVSTSSLSKLLNNEDVDEEELLQTRPFNQRIELPTAGEFSDDDGDERDDVHDIDEEELTRDKVKKAAQHAPIQKEKEQKRKKKKKRADS
ncbi:unnamed protein product [Chrysoparadoxa australica]